MKPTLIAVPEQTSFALPLEPISAHDVALSSSPLTPIKPKKSRRATSPLEHHIDRLMRRPAVEYATGLSRSSLYRLMALNDFPAPVQLSSNSIAWLESGVVEWISRRVAASRDGNGAANRKRKRP